jgi:branched-chain amino acid transport system permease protein
MLPGGVFSTKYETDVAILRTKTQWFLLALGIMFLFVIPLFAPDYWLSQLTYLAIVIVAVLGLHVLTGLCGQISIGHAAFMAVGAYAIAILTTRYEPFGADGDWIWAWLCLPISALAAGLVGLIFGLPCFKLKGFYLAISTLAAWYIIIWCLKYDGFSSVTGGFIGLPLDPLHIGGTIEGGQAKGALIDFSSRGSLYCLAVAVMIVAAFIAKNIQRTAAGRAFVAIRDNELAAEVNGINIFRYKMLAFFIGCLFAGVAGWLWAHSQLRVNPNQFSLLDSIWYVGMLIIGGWGSTSGVFFGAAFLKLLEIGMTDYITPWLGDMLPSIKLQVHVATDIVRGMVIVLFMMLAPRGIYYLGERLKIYYRLHPYAYWAR